MVLVPYRTVLVASYTELYRYRYRTVPYRTILSVSIWIFVLFSKRENIPYYRYRYGNVLESISTRKWSYIPYGTVPWNYFARKIVFVIIVLTDTLKYLGNVTWYLTKYEVTTLRTYIRTVPYGHPQKLKKF